MKKLLVILLLFFVVGCEPASLKGKYTKWKNEIESDPDAPKNNSYTAFAYACKTESCLDHITHGYGLSNASQADADKNAIDECYKNIEKRKKKGKKVKVNLCKLLYSGDKNLNYQTLSLPQLCAHWRYTMEYTSASREEYRVKISNELDRRGERYNFCVDQQFDTEFTIKKLEEKAARAEARARKAEREAKAAEAEASAAKRRARDAEIRAMQKY